MRNLSKSYQFTIDAKTNNWVEFINLYGNRLRKLTPSQWAKASKYCTRRLINFIGYNYEIKPEYKGKIIKVI